MRRRILVIAGSDSSGGASVPCSSHSTCLLILIFYSGLEADQRVIAAHKCYAMTATTALTAQNTMGVIAVHQTPPDFVRQQIDACIDDIGVDVVKTGRYTDQDGLISLSQQLAGMLASAETIDVVADALERHGRPVSVIDPVRVSFCLVLPKQASERPGSEGPSVFSDCLSL